MICSSPLELFCSLFYYICGALGWDFIIKIFLAVHAKLTTGATIVAPPQHAAWRSAWSGPRRTLQWWWPPTRDNTLTHVLPRHGPASVSCTPNQMRSDPPVDSICCPNSTNSFVMTKHKHRLKLKYKCYTTPPPATPLHHHLWMLLTQLLV